MRLYKLSAALAVLVFPGFASADPCTGASPFTDVSAAAIYCTNTEWLKNRNITLGCTATTYCPDDPVTRASMALFLNRLGTALLPHVQNVGLSSMSSFDLDESPPARTCSIGFTVPDYPRRAVVLASFSGLAAGALDYSAQIVRSFDDGLTYSALPTQLVRGGASGARWTTASLHGVTDVDVGILYLGIRVARVAGPVASTADFDATQCVMRVVLFNRTGTTSPFDAASTLGGVD